MSQSQRNLIELADPKLRSFRDYCTYKFCQSCAYFNSIKGHFGSCVEPNTKKPAYYDGAKKGSACVLWRIKSNLSGLETELKQPEPIIHRISLRRRFRSCGKKQRPYVMHRQKLLSVPCPKCNSDNTVKAGIRHNHCGPAQEYDCHDCGVSFSRSFKLRTLGMKHNWVTVRAALLLTERGLSTREIAPMIGVSHSAVHWWIRKYGTTKTSKWIGMNLKTLIYSLNQGSVERTLLSEGLASTDHLPRFLSEIVQLLPNTEWYDAKESHASELSRNAWQQIRYDPPPRLPVEPHRPCPTCCGHSFSNRKELQMHRFEVHAY